LENHLYNILKLEFFTTETIIFTGFMTGVTGLFGGWDTAFMVFATFIALDILAGVSKGLYLNEFSSKRFRKGMATKFGYIVIVVMATQLDKLMPEDLPLIRTMTIYFYIFVEGSSILENLAIMGIPVPKVLTQRMEQVRDASGESSDQ